MTPTPDHDSDDPKHLIREAFRIEGITYGECRSIFMDWALSLPAARDPVEAISALLARHAGGAPDHPMLAVLNEGREAPVRPRRRGGWRGRRSAALPDTPSTSNGDPS